MKKLSIFLFFCAISTLLISCDPIKLLIIKSTDDVAVTVYTNNTIVLENSAKRAFRVPENGITELNFYYGYGNWPKQAIIEFSASIDSIVFKKAEKEKILKEQVDIQSYLMKQRKNILKNHLIIEPR